MFDERAKEIERIERIAVMLVNMPQDTREEITGELDVHFKDLKANLQGYIAERIDYHRAFATELLTRPYRTTKIVNGLELLASDVEDTEYGVTEMLEDIMVTMHAILQQRDHS